MTKLCGCGTCEDAAERATQFVCRLIDDDECGYFLYAVGTAIGQITTKLMQDSVNGEVKAAGLIDALATAAAAAEGAAAASHIALQKERMQLVHSAMDRSAERRKEEQKLPKGH
jgi:hypothetical protein